MMTSKNQYLNQKPTTSHSKVEAMFSIDWFETQEKANRYNAGRA